MGDTLPSLTALTDNARIRVLIVDDHQMVAESLAAALQREPDIELVGIAGTALEAKRLAETERPDVVLMDFRLPDQDGAAATEAIKARRPETQVVMVTSADDEAVLLRCVEAGCSGFIPKDRPVRELVEAVRAVHAGEALVSPPMLARLLPRLRPSHRDARPDLTPRELDILGLLAQGISNQVIADQLGISRNTVRNHVQSILSKLEAHSKLEAVSTAVREGIIRYP
jgi:DNA-binding NarL/FixJ family response regulator